MSENSDKLNYIKNLIWMMCCDGDIAESEKQFLFRVAREIGASIDNWNSLVKEVLADNGQLYSISDRQKAIATFKSLVIMAKADNKIDRQEKEYILRFAKSLGLTNKQFKTISREIDMSTLLDSFKTPSTPQNVSNSRIVAIREDFDRIEEFTKVAGEQDVDTKITGLDQFLAGTETDDDIVCFHAAEDKSKSIQRCRDLLSKAGDKTAGILTRYQGHQVKYLREIGLSKCVIEPVYSHDIDTLLK